VTGAQEHAAPRVDYLARWQTLRPCMKKKKTTRMHGQKLKQHGKRQSESWKHLSQTSTSNNIAI
jgi:hypothetical protein